MPPSLSVVIPTHDTRALTLACLRALAPELPADAEVVVVDDGSSDDTAAAIRAEFSAAFPAVHVLALAPARGFTAAANAGLAAARGRILWLLNSDTEAAPGAVAVLLAAFARAPRLGAAGAALFFPDGRPQRSGGGAPTPRWLFALASGFGSFVDRVPGYRRPRPVAGHDAQAIVWVPGAALALRAEAWRAVGPFDETLRLYAQDLDLCLRLRAAGWDVAVVRAARVMHHGGAVGRLAGATTGRQEVRLLWTDLARVMAKHHGAAAGARCVAMLRRGAALRLVLRTVALPFVPRARRAAWRRDTDVYVRARAALASLPETSADTSE